jgi:hypothetical protein
VCHETGAPGFFKFCNYTYVVYINAILHIRQDGRMMRMPQRISRPEKINIFIHHGAQGEKYK